MSYRYLQRTEPREYINRLDVSFHVDYTLPEVDSELPDKRGALQCSEQDKLRCETVAPCPASTRNQSVFRSNLNADKQRQIVKKRRQKEALAEAARKYRRRKKTEEVQLRQTVAALEEEQKLLVKKIEYLKSQIIFQSSRRNIDARRTSEEQEEKNKRLRDQVNKFRNFRWTFSCLSSSLLSQSLNEERFC